MAGSKIVPVLLDKGEKYGLYAAAGIALLLVVAGVVNLMDDYNPEVVASEIASKTQQIDQKLKAPDATDHPVPKTPVDPFKDEIKTKIPQQPWFNPGSNPDTRRVNPTILTLADFQIDYLPVRIRGLDIQGTEPDQRIGILEKIKDEENRDNALLQAEITRRWGDPIKNKKKRAQANLGQGAILQNNGQFQGGMNLGQGGMNLGQGGWNGPNGMNFGGYPNMGGTAILNRQDNVKETERMGVKYVPYNSDDWSKATPAQTIYPSRMVVVQAAFPYKQQVDEYMSISVSVRP